MPRFRFRILDVMAVIVFAAVILGFKTYLDRESFGPGSAHEPALAVYVALLCTALVGVRSGRALASVLGRRRLLRRGLPGGRAAHGLGRDRLRGVRISPPSLRAGPAVGDLVQNGGSMAGDFTC